MVRRAPIEATDFETFRGELTGYCYRMLGSGSEAEDAVMSMPPFAMWVRGAREIGHFMLEPTPSLCRGSRLVPVSANGCPASGHYKPGPAGGLRAWSLQVLEVVAGRITGFHCFLGTETLFPYFGLPLSLDGQAGE